MSILLVSEDLRLEFINLCKQNKLADPLYTTTTKEGISIPILHLDKLWHKKEVIEKASNLSIKAIKESSNFDDKSIDFVVGITSRLGSYGPIPIVSRISFEFGFDILIASESNLGEFTLYPSKLNMKRFKGKKFLLFKDGIARGASISRTAELVQSLDGKLAGIFTFVDLDNLTDQAEKIIQATPTIEFLHGDMLNQIL